MTKHWWVQAAYFTLGLLSLAMAYVGAIMPGIPTIPFVLIALFAFLRSSPRMHAWLLRHRLFGRIASDFQERKGSPTRLALIVLLPSWGSVIVALIWFISNVYGRLALVTLAISGSIWFIRLLQKHFKHPKGISQDPT